MTTGDNRSLLVFWIVAGITVICVVGIAATATVLIDRNSSPEKLCATRLDPPEFCRELAKRKQP